MQIGGYSKGALLLIKVGRPYISLLRGWQITPLILLTHILGLKFVKTMSLLTPIWTFSGLKIPNYALFNVLYVVWDLFTTREFGLQDNGKSKEKLWISM